MHEECVLAADWCGRPLWKPRMDVVELQSLPQTVRSRTSRARTGSVPTPTSAPSSPRAIASIFSFAELLGAFDSLVCITIVLPTTQLNCSIDRRGMLLWTPCRNVPPLCQACILREDRAHRGENRCCSPNFQHATDSWA